MGFGSEIEDDEGYLGELKEEDGEEKEDDLSDDSELGEEKDFEDDRINCEEPEDDLGQELSEEKEEALWDEIDWNEDLQGEREKTIWDEIDWNEDLYGEREKTIWDKIDWNEDLHGEREKNVIDKNDDQNEKYNKEDYVENVESQSISTILATEMEEIEDQMEHQEHEEIEIPPEEYQDDTGPNVNADEIEFIKDVEKMAEYARETIGEDENVEPQAEKENAAYYAEQYYKKLKEKEVENDQNSKEDQEIEEHKQEVTEEFKNMEDINETSKENMSPEEFEYLWNVREELDREGKSDKEIKEIMHEAEEMYKTLKEAEKVYEEQQQEKLNLVDHEDEASIEDLKEDLDRVDLIEQAVELEESLIQQGKLQEEIDVKVEKAIERTEFEEELEKLHKEQEQEKLKQESLDHEENIGNLKEDLDRVDLIEQVVELEENLAQQGKLQEEIDVKVEEAIEMAEFREEIEKLHENQEQEKLKQNNHEDGENFEDLKEEIDRPAEAEYYMEKAEELHRQGKSQEEINEQMEEVVSNYQKEINKKQEKEEEPNVNEEIEKQDLEINEKNSSAENRYKIEQSSTLHNEKKAKNYENVENKEKLEVLKLELDTIESESENKKELLEEGSKLTSEETDEEENEHLQELYRQQTDKRPIYAKKRTKGYIQWLEQRELDLEKINNSQSENESKKEIEEEDWEITLKKWIKEASEDECSAELKSELKIALERYNEFDYLTRKFMELFEKSQYEKLSEKEKNRIKSLTEKLQKIDPIQLELLANIRAIKKYIIEQYGWDSMNRFLDYRVRNRFFTHVSQKYDLWSSNKVRMVSPSSFTNDELEFYKRKKIDLSKIKTRWAWVKNKQIAVEFYKEVILPKFDNVPKAHDMDGLGYRGFRSSIKKLGLGVNDLTKAAGFNPYHEERYTGMNYDELLKFFKENVYPEVKNKLKLKIGEAPGAGYLERKGLGYRGFVDRVRIVSKLEGIKRNIWAEFVKKVGLEPLKDLKYRGMDFVELMDLFVKKIYPNLKEKYNLDHKQAPFKEQVDKEYNGFRKAIRRLGYKLSDLYIALDFKHKFWQIYHNKSYKELLNFFKDIIQPSLQDIYDFSETEAPSYEEVEINYRGFIEALNRHGKKLSDVINNLGYIPRKFSNIGVITHALMNSLLSYYINDKNFLSNYYSEVELFSSSKHRIDGFMFVTPSLISFFRKHITKLYPKINNKKEREEILLLLRKIEGKQHLLIDFSNGFFKRSKINSEIIAIKAKKYLDYPSSFLILIGTNWSNVELSKRLPTSIKYKDSYYTTKDVALISPELFGILLGINSPYKDYLNNIILYNKNEDIDKLQDINKSLERIKNLNYFSTEEFNKIKQNNTLIRWL